MFCRGSEDDRVIFWREKRRTARKEHICVECNEKIPPGSRYLDFARGFIDAWNIKQFVAWKVCPRCEEDWNEILRVFRDNFETEVFIVYGALEEAINEAFGKGYLTKDDPLAQAWLDIENTAEEVSEAQLALSRIRQFSAPLL